MTTPTDIPTDITTTTIIGRGKNKETQDQDRKK